MKFNTDAGLVLDTSKRPSYLLYALEAGMSDADQCAARLIPLCFCGSHFPMQMHYGPLRSP